VISEFVDALPLDRYALYIFDYGAPVGRRLAMRHPERVIAIISQNGNAYVDGFSHRWGPWEDYWRDPSEANRQACRPSLSPDTIKNWQYGTGADPARLSPDGYELDIAYMARPGGGGDTTRPDPRLSQQRRALSGLPGVFPQASAAAAGRLGRHDPAFVPAGAEAYKRDNPATEVHLLDAGHFALETHADDRGSDRRLPSARLAGISDRAKFERRTTQ
jgi:pimeloyl-ACP methyl ester carboxylesterase